MPLQLVSSGMDRWSLQGRKVVVTGGTKGIGLAIAKEMLSLGATVLVVSRSEEGSAITARSLCDEFGVGRCLGMAADLSTKEGREALMQDVEKTWGALDCLVNNAGVNVRAKMLDATDEHYDSILRTNMDGCYYTCKLAYPLLVKGDKPCIVNVASVAGVGSTGTGAIYAMSKAAMIQLTKSLACEWAKDNIRVNCVAPWVTNTGMVASQDPKVSQKIAEATPARRPAEPHEIASAVTFFSLSAASYVTGQTMCVDGGLSAELFAGPCTD